MIKLQSVELAKWMKRLGYDNPNSKLIMFADLNSHYHPWNPILKAYDTNFSSVEYATFAKTYLSTLPRLRYTKTYGNYKECLSGSKLNLTGLGYVCKPDVQFKFVDTYKVINGQYKDVFTFDGRNNPSAGEGFFSGIPPEFIDCIFVNSKKHFRVLDSKLVFTESLGEPKFLSDHYGVLTTLKLKP